MTRETQNSSKTLSVKRVLKDSCVVVIRRVVELLDTPANTGKRVSLAKPSFNCRLKSCPGDQIFILGVNGATDRHSLAMSNRRLLEGKHSVEYKRSNTGLSPVSPLKHAYRPVVKTLGFQPRNGISTIPRRTKRNYASVPNGKQLFSKTSNGSSNLPACAYYLGLAPFGSASSLRLECWKFESSTLDFKNAAKWCELGLVWKDRSLPRQSKRLNHHDSSERRVPSAVKCSEMFKFVSKLSSYASHLNLSLKFLRVKVRWSRCLCVPPLI